MRLFGEDQPRLKRFYNKLFGWTFHDLFNGSYVYFETGGPMAGNLQRPLEGEPATAMNFIEVESIDAIVPRLSALGGRLIVAKRRVGAIGFEAVFEDPERNLMGLFEHVRKPAPKARSRRRAQSASPRRGK